MTTRLAYFWLDWMAQHIHYLDANRHMNGNESSDAVEFEYIDIERSHAHHRPIYFNLLQCGL